MAKIDEKSAQKLLQSSDPKTDPITLNELVKENNPDININISKNPGSTAETLLLLVEVGGLELQILEHQNVDNQIINKIIDKVNVVNSSTLPILEKIVKHDEFNEQIFEKLYNSDSCSTLRYFRIFYHAARNPLSPVGVIKKLMEMGGVEKIGVAENPSINVKVLEELSNDDNPYVRICVARNPNTPSKLLKKLYDDVISGQYDKILHNYRLSPYRLYNNDDVLANIASHANTPKAIINSLSEKFPISVLKNPNVSPDLMNSLLIRLSDEHDPHARLTVARCVNTPTSILMKLVDAIIKLPKITLSDVNVLTAIIFNQNVTREILEKLSTINNDLIRLRIKNNPAYII